MGDFLKQISESLEKLLSGVLSEGHYGLFSKAPQIVLGVPYSKNSGDCHLFLLGYDVVERESGTFRYDDGQGASLVFRNPARICVNYQILGSQALLSSRPEIWDKLLGFFFDHPSMDPFLPPAMKALPGLYEKLSEVKATVVLKCPSFSGHASNGDEPVCFNLQYTALYHSGAILSREALVKQRIIEYRNRERSLP